MPSEEELAVYDTDYLNADDDADGPDGDSAADGESSESEEDK